MAEFVRGENNDPTNPKLQLFLIDGTNAPIDAAYVGFRILDITNSQNKCIYAQHQFNKIQVYPAQGPSFLNVDVLYTEPDPGHKLGPGNYYAPWTAPPNLKVGEYVIIWEWKVAAASPFRVTKQSFAVKEF